LVFFALVGVGVAVACWTTPIGDMLCFDFTRPFSTAEWLRADPRTRDKMARTLASSGILRDRTKAEVLEFLGPPDHIDGGGTDFIYWVDFGFRWPFSSGRSRLRIMFDKEGDYNIVFRVVVSKQ
jgi:hypothetical protein